MDAVLTTIDSWVEALRRMAPADTYFNHTFNIYAFAAVLIVSIICGAVGALVVGNRMAFFSDALAHCAFAGVALGVLLWLLLRIPIDLREWLTLIMIVFGVVVGVLIAYVRDRTGLASDTVIGVFFAGAIGLGAVFTRLAPGNQFNIESFIFGQPAAAKAQDILYLLGLLVLVVVFLARYYNDVILASLNPSLALSRNVPVYWHRYLFVILLGLIVNLCLQIVGALLINALLIVPAATAANFCRNLRQLFWWSVTLCLVCGIGGLFVSWEISIREVELRPGVKLQIGAGGTIVVFAVLLFAFSMFLGPLLRDRPTSAARAE